MTKRICIILTGVISLLMSVHRVACQCDWKTDAYGYQNVKNNSKDFLRWELVYGTVPNEVGPSTGADRGDDCFFLANGGSDGSKAWLLSPCYLCATTTKRVDLSYSFFLYGENAGSIIPYWRPGCLDPQDLPNEIGTLVNQISGNQFNGWLSSTRSINTNLMPDEPFQIVFEAIMVGEGNNSIGVDKISLESVIPYEPTTSTTQPASIPTIEPTHESMPYIITAAVGVLLCIIVVAVILLTRKNAQRNIRRRNNAPNTTNVGEDSHAEEMMNAGGSLDVDATNAGASLDDGNVDHTYSIPFENVDASNAGVSLDDGDVEHMYLTPMENVEATNVGASPVEGDEEHMYLTPMENLPIDSAHVTFDHLRFIKELGSGEYGSVWLAETNIKTRLGISTKVAVKTNKDDATPSEKDDLMREMELMKKFKSHPNVVELLASFSHEGSHYLVLEFMVNGMLRDVLRESRRDYDYAYTTKRDTQSSLSQNQLMKFAKQVADGMDFITSNHCVHRDLAARNVLVSEDLVCKVSDFGFAREEDEYHRKTDTKQPFRWMAIESLVDGIHTAQSDVWSYGVLLWEIVTLGARPYPEMGGRVIIRELRQGYRMPQPSHCFQEVYDLMLACWSADPSQRPSFADISRSIGRIMETKADHLILDEIDDQLYDDVADIDDDEKI